VGSTETGMRFQKEGSVSDANGNILLADPSRFWADPSRFWADPDPDPVPKCGSADPASRGAGSSNIESNIKTKYCNMLCHALKFQIIFDPCHCLRMVIRILSDVVKLPSPPFQQRPWYLKTFFKLTGIHG
jgi:hypothetical protein